jgi:hypothetical protein
MACATKYHAINVMLSLSKHLIGHDRDASTSSCFDKLSMTFFCFYAGSAAGVSRHLGAA